MRWTPVRSASDFAGALPAPPFGLPGYLAPLGSRYLDGNTKELATIRVPTEEEEQRRLVHRQRTTLVRARTKLQAQGRCMLLNFGQPTIALLAHLPSTRYSPPPPRWWRKAGWRALERVVPAWLLERLAVYRPLLEALDEQIAALTTQIEAAAPTDLPAGLGKLTTVTVSREICDWRRFRNRRVSPTHRTRAIPLRLLAGQQLHRALPGRILQRRQTRARRRHQAWPRWRRGIASVRSVGEIRACAPHWSSSPGGWSASSPAIHPSVNGSSSSPKVRRPPAPRARKPSWPSPASSARPPTEHSLFPSATSAVDLWRLHTGQCSAEKLGFQP